MHLSMRDFCESVPGTQADAVAAAEQVVLRAISYRFPPFSVLPCLLGFLMDFARAVELNDEDAVDALKQHALDCLQRALLLDQLVLAQPPSRVALACVLEAAALAGCDARGTASYWDARLARHPEHVALHTALAHIRHALRALHEPSAALLRPIDRKLRDARASLPGK